MILKMMLWQEESNETENEDSDATTENEDQDEQLWDDDNVIYVRYTKKD